jgi:hypothetical protein
MHLVYSVWYSYFLIIHDCRAYIECFGKKRCNVFCFVKMIGRCPDNIACIWSLVDELNMLLIIFMVTEITQLRTIFINETKWATESTYLWAVSTKVVSTDVDSMTMHEFVLLMRFSISVDEILRTIQHRRMLGVNWQAAIIDPFYLQMSRLWRAILPRTDQHGP